MAFFFFWEVRHVGDRSEGRPLHKKQDEDLTPESVTYRKELQGGVDEDEVIPDDGDAED